MNIWRNNWRLHNWRSRRTQLINYFWPPNLKLHNRTDTKLIRQLNFYESVVFFLWLQHLSILFQKKGPNEHPKMALVRTDLAFYLIDETPDIIGAMPGTLENIYLVHQMSTTNPELWNYKLFTNFFPNFFLFKFPIYVKIDKKKRFVLTKKNNLQPFIDWKSWFADSGLVVDIWWTR